jgi:hypothetical protein
MIAALDVLAIAALLLIGAGALRLARAIRAEQQRRAWSAYRAASLVVESKRALRAGQRRAAAREWGRVA